MQHSTFFYFHYFQQNSKLKSIKGVKGLSCLLAFKNFNLVDGFAIDYMHNVLLGVVRAILNIWFDPRNSKKNFYLNKKKRLLLDIRLLSIKKCSFIGRSTRSLAKLAYFKANELRNLLLFYLRISLDGLLPKKYIIHFQILSDSIYRLLKTEISCDELNSIEADLNRFVKEYQFFYGGNSMTMNIHLITHLVQTVRNNGPLWTTSMFAFESNNGSLLKLFNGSREVLQQISSKYILRHIHHVKHVLESTKSIRTPIVLTDSQKIKLNAIYSKQFIDMGIPVPHDGILEKKNTPV